MAVVNSFGLLDDEEGDDVNFLVKELVKKVERGKIELESFNDFDNGQSERGQYRGSSQDRGNGRGGYRRNHGDGQKDHHPQNGHRRNYSYSDKQKSDGIQENSTGRSRRGGMGRSRGRGRGKALNNNNGGQNTRQANAFNNVNENENDDNGWQYVGKPKSYVSQSKINEDDHHRVYKNGNGSWNSGGEKRFSHSKSRHGDAGWEKPNGHLHSRGKFGRGRGGYRRTCNGEVRKNDENVGVENNANTDNFTDNLPNGVASDSVVASEVSKDAETEEKKISEEVNGDNADQKQNTGQKMDQDGQDKEAKLMTLSQYEEMLSEKRKALKVLSTKTEERKVTVDKDMKNMQLVKKKEDEIFIQLKPKKEKLKMKCIAEVQESEEPLPQKSEVLKSDGLKKDKGQWKAMKSEKSELKKDGRWKENGHQTMESEQKSEEDVKKINGSRKGRAVDVTEFFGPASYAYGDRRGRGGRGGERGGRQGGSGGHRRGIGVGGQGRQKSGGGNSSSSKADQMNSDKDFPSLGVDATTASGC